MLVYILSSIFVNKTITRSKMLVSRYCIYKRSLWASLYAKLDFRLVGWLAGVKPPENSDNAEVEISWNI